MIEGEPIKEPRMLKVRVHFKGRGDITKSDVCAARKGNKIIFDTECQSRKVLNVAAAEQIREENKASIEDRRKTIDEFAQTLDQIAAMPREEAIRKLTDTANHLRKRDFGFKKIGE